MEDIPSCLFLQSYERNLALLEFIDCSIPCLIGACWKQSISRKGHYWLPAAQFHVCTRCTCCTNSWECTNGQLTDFGKAANHFLKRTVPYFQILQITLQFAISLFSVKLSVIPYYSQKWTNLRNHCLHILNMPKLIESQNMQRVCVV